MSVCKSFESVPENSFYNFNCIVNRKKNKLKTTAKSRPNSIPINEGGKSFHYIISDMQTFDKRFCYHFYQSKAWLGIVPFNVNDSRAILNLITGELDSSSFQEYLVSASDVFMKCLLIKGDVSSFVAMRRIDRNIAKITDRRKFGLNYLISMFILVKSLYITNFRTFYKDVQKYYRVKFTSSNLLHNNLFEFMFRFMLENDPMIGDYFDVFIRMIMSGKIQQLMETEDITTGELKPSLMRTEANARVGECRCYDSCICTESDLVKNRCRCKKGGCKCGIYREVCYSCSLNFGERLDYCVNGDAICLNYSDINVRFLSHLKNRKYRINLKDEDSLVVYYFNPTVFAKCELTPKKYRAELEEFVNGKSKG